MKCLKTMTLYLGCFCIYTHKESIQQNDILGWAKLHKLEVRIVPLGPKNRHLIAVYKKFLVIRSFYLLLFFINMREIITVQLGSIANHVGTHFWNAQVNQKQQDLGNVKKKLILYIL
jgi:hypothetical protein